MNTAHILRRLNNEFYATQADSFAATRHVAWPGWNRVASIVRSSCEGPLRILDVACGTMRFEQFWNDAYSAQTARFVGVDSCPTLAASLPNTVFEERDIVSCLLAGELILTGREPGSFDAAVCFGFLHHVPGFEARLALVDQLLDAVRAGGVVAVALWRFMSSGKLAEKAERSTAEALESLDVTLDVDDYLVGWQGREGVWRYCHHFDDAEVDALALHASRRAQVLDRFRDDGRSGELNTYLVFRRG